MSKFSKYQKGGIYPWANDRIIPAVKEIVRAVGVPDVLVSSYQPNGVGLHRTGEAADFQAGKMGSRLFPDGKRVHQAIADYAIANWTRLRIRYMAWNGWEYGGSWGGPERKRRQVYEPWHKNASDPWHKNHVHIDFLPGKIPGAKPDIAIAGETKVPSIIPSLPTNPSKDEVMIIIRSKESVKHYITNGLVKRHIKTPAELNVLNKFFGATQTVPQSTVDAIPFDDRAWFTDKTKKTNAAVGRLETMFRETSRLVSDTAAMTEQIAGEVVDEEYRKTLRQRVEQNNAALGRMEKEYKSLLSSITEDEHEGDQETKITEEDLNS